MTPFFETNPVDRLDALASEPVATCTAGMLANLAAASGLRNWHLKGRELIPVVQGGMGVGLPLDLVVYEANKLQTDRVICIDAENPYYRMMHNSWGQKLREVFDSIEDPVWDDAASAHPLKMPAARHSALRKISTPEEKLI